MQCSTLEIEVSEERMRQVQAAIECATDIGTVRDQLEGLCAKFAVPTE